MEFYRNVEEAITGYMPVTRGKLMSTHCFVVAIFAGDTEPIKSHCATDMVQKEAELS